MDQEPSLTPALNLQPCPFCGRADLLHVETAERGFLRVKCWACGAVGGGRGGSSDAEAAAHWNHRAKATEIPLAQLENWLCEVELLWQLNDDERGPTKGGLEGAVARCEVPVISEMRNAVERARRKAHE